MIYEWTPHELGRGPGGPTPDEIGLGHLPVSLPSPKSPVPNITVKGRIQKC